MEDNDKKLILGFLLGVVLAIDVVILSNFIPVLEFDNGIIVLTHNGFGPRLYIWGFHIHHYIYGVIMCVIGIPVICSEKYPLFGGFVTGFGALLILSQIPMILGFIAWGP